MKSRQLQALTAVILGLNILLAGFILFLLIRNGKPTATPPPVVTSTVGTEITSASVLPATPIPSSTTQPSATITPIPPSPTPVPVDPVKILAVGDVVVCDDAGAQITAGMLDMIPDIPVLLLGDTINEEATADAFSACFEPTWGRHKARLYPIPGNHDYDVEDAQPYFDYFGNAAGEAGKGYYSFNQGAWHIIALNSNCNEIDGCDLESHQYSWLLQDLASHPTQCTLVYWHHPLFSSDKDGGLEQMRDIWRLLYDSNVDLILNGHDHLFERFAPQTPGGLYDEERGIRQFVIGTGGAGLRGVNREPPPTGEKQIMGAYGLLELTLYSNRYEWQFVPQPGILRSDSGSGICH